MILLMAFQLATAQPDYPDYPDYKEVVGEQVARRAEIHTVQRQCESLLLRYTEYSRRNRKYLQKTSWDLPGGWVDPTSIENSRRQFMKIAILLRDNIDRVQRSPRPRVAECKVAYDAAMHSHLQLLRPMLYNGR